MTPPEITRLELNAAIASKRAASAQAAAEIAALEYQSSLVGPADRQPSSARSSNFIGITITIVLGMFCAWSYLTELEHEERSKPVYVR